jgi:hypothetical protein
LWVENREGRGHENVLHDLQAGLGRDRAIRVPTHTVENQHHGGIF